MQQSTPEGSDFLGFGKHGAKMHPGGTEVGSRVMPLDRPSGASTNPLESQEIRFLAEDAECSPGAELGEQHDTGASDETPQTMREDTFFAEMQASKNSTNVRKRQNRKVPISLQLWRREIWC